MTELGYLRWRVTRLTLFVLLFVLFSNVYGAAPRLELLGVQSDLVFKGYTLSDAPETNSVNRHIDVHDLPHLTKFRVISVLQGQIKTNIVIFRHDTFPAGGFSFMPAFYELNPGTCYLVFAAETDKPGIFEQIRKWPASEDFGVLRTLDRRPLGDISIRDAYWLELNRLLTNSIPTNRIYAIKHMRSLTFRCKDSWGNVGDFKRGEVMERVLERLADDTDEVAITAIQTFSFSESCSDDVERYANRVLDIANQSTNTTRRAAAIATFAGSKLPGILPHLPKWLRDRSEEVRIEAVGLLPDYSAEFSGPELRAAATDLSPPVRARVAEAIGRGQFTNQLSTLVKLFADPIGQGKPLPSLSGGITPEGEIPWSPNPADVHTWTGAALLKLDITVVANILKTNLSDPVFHMSFLCKLAEKDAAPYLNELVGFLEKNRDREAPRWQAARGVPLTGMAFTSWGIVYEYLHDAPFAIFTNGRSDHYLDVLETAGNTGSSEPEKLYELYRMKGLNQRAVKIRKEWEHKYPGDFMERVFNATDAKYPQNGTVSHQ